MLETYLNAKWALESTFHDRMAKIALERVANGHTPFAATAEGVEKGRRDPYFVSVYPGQAQDASTVAASTVAAGSWGYEKLQKEKAESGRIVVLPIIGTMSRYGDFCTYGTEDYAQWIIEANDDPSVSAIVLELNSPGGQVDGTEYLGEVIRQSKKPVVAFVAGMAASAAYWIASQAKMIVMESATSSEVGSIGVLAMHVDASAAYEKVGYKVTIVRATGSTDKALFNSIEPLSETVLAETKEILDAIRDTFEATVKAGRPGIASDVFTGKMYIGRDALKKKMADKIGFLGDAIAEANRLALAA
ncbi:signal peptide peptidase SppA [Larkinella arboricola]|uniref:Signal peptide peptidase SppA n=1 Tax=Larkinella arboricola TaxID=643671 RepID=A0A327WNT1_LARAB|nr:S49 family peptidase [Larkinella arboricola]RAJ92227.1 signal peptide peptidase SppA [Larkinella arboricola]